MKSNTNNNMKRISLLFIISLFINGVFGDEVISVFVMKGSYVTLQIDRAHIRDEIVEHFAFYGIAELITKDKCDADKRNTQILCLTSTNITISNAGHYQLDIKQKFPTNQLVSANVSCDVLSVMEGDSVTLHSHLTELQSKDVIVWRFNGCRIAKINREVSENPVYEPSERFTDRLKMNPQTGDLTITNITSQHTGDYELSREALCTLKKFNVSVSPKVETVIYGDSVTLHINIPEHQRNDKIHWKIKHNNSTVAEIIREAGRVTKNETYNGFRGRLKLNNQTGNLIITNMTNEDSGYYEADVTIGINAFTIHKTFCFGSCDASEKSFKGLPSGGIAGICVSLLVVVIVAGVIFKCKNQGSNRGI